MRTLVSKLKQLLSKQVWNIGITKPIELGKANYAIDYSLKINWIKGLPRDNWYADPFILNHDDKTFEILVEEYIANDAKGVISLLIIDAKSFRILKTSRLLELDTHLSFPLIYKDSGRTFVIPENYQSGQLSIYEYDKITKRLVNPRIILNEAVVDTSIQKIDEYYYIFTTKYSQDNYGGSKELHIYKSTGIMGPYHPHQVISFDSPIARGAGAIVHHGNNYYIPTQNCTTGYGKQVIINKLSLEDGMFTISEISRISPFRPYNNGVHTYNELDDYAVIDGYKYKYGLFSQLLSRIYNLIKK